MPYKQTKPKNTSKLTIIMPAHNEERRISETIKEYTRYFDKVYGNNYDLLVVVNGSKDKTVEVVKKLMKITPSLSYKNYPGRIGKGGAIAKGLKFAKGDLVAFVDADLSTSPEMFDRLITVINLIPNLDCTIASRNMEGSLVEGRTSKRKIMTKAFNIYVNFLFNLNIRDTQCGAKVFRRSVLPKVIPNLSISNMAFDVNFLVELKRIGAKTMEVPINWIDDADSTITKPVKTSLVMALSLLRLKIISSRFSAIYKIIFKPFSELAWRVLLTKEERETRIIQN